MRIPVRNIKGDSAGELDVRDDIFGIEPNEAVMHQALVRQLANKRQGTADTKTRAEVAGGTRKLYKQKGTGHARQGDNRAPHWRKGGIVGGPTPRSYEQAMPKKMRRLALKSALSAKAQANQLFVLDEFKFDAPKTKNMVQLLDSLKLRERALVLLSGDEENVLTACRNLRSVKTLSAKYLNVSDILTYDAVIASRGAIQLIEQTYGGQG
ncbi:MAG: 50S ribosomal protein L4 [Chloroflexi bacterium]|nr:50S ribosomal protein L4 [Chloroflexota bacterium]